MTRPIVTHTKLRGPSGNATRARRRAANTLALRFMRAFKTECEDKHPEFVIEAARMVIRALAMQVEDKGDAGRALGVLNGAGIDLVPAYRDGRQGVLAEAEAVFGEPST